MTLVVKEAVPVITSSLSETSKVAVAFSYTITASASPARFAASGLPAGLTVSSSTGKVSGKPTKAGMYSVLLSASNSDGKGTVKLSLVVK